MTSLAIVRLAIFASSKSRDLWVVESFLWLLSFGIFAVTRVNGGEVNLVLITHRRGRNVSTDDWRRKLEMVRRPPYPPYYCYLGVTVTHVAHEL